jgi:hypothetical protein
MNQIEATAQHQINHIFYHINFWNFILKDKLIGLINGNNILYLISLKGIIIETLLLL